MSPVDSITAAGPHAAEVLLGSNGTTATWQGETPDGKKVALVVIDKEQVTKTHAWPVAQEAMERIRSGAEGTRVVRPLDWGEAEDFYWAAYEWLPGRHIGSLIQEHGLPAPADTLGIAAQILEALGTLQDLELAHRVITPASIFLTDGGEAVLLHAGWAPMLLATEDGPADAALISNLPFLAPEVAGSFPSQETSADVYSLASNLYFFFTGQPVHWLDDPDQLAGAISSTAPDLSPLREVLPESACELLEEMLEMEPDDRPVNLAALRDRLLHLADEFQHDPPSAATDGPPPALVEDEVSDVSGSPSVPSQHPEGTPPPLPPEQASTPGPGSFEQPPAQAGANEEESSGRMTALQAAVAAGLAQPNQSVDELRRRSHPGTPKLTMEVTEQKPKASGAKKLLIVLGGLAATLVILCGVGWAVMSLFVSDLENQMTESLERTTREIEQRQTTTSRPSRDEDSITTQQRLREVGQLHRNYLRDYGIWARRIDELKSPEHPRDLFEDAWGKPFDLRDAYVVSAGSDGRWDTADDLWFDANARELGGRVVPEQEDQSEAGGSDEPTE